MHTLCPGCLDEAIKSTRNSVGGTTSQQTSAIQAEHTSSPLLFPFHLSRQIARKVAISRTAQQALVLVGVGLSCCCQPTLCCLERRGGAEGFCSSSILQKRVLRTRHTWRVVGQAGATRRRWFRVKVPHPQKANRHDKARAAVPDSSAVGATLTRVVAAADALPQGQLRQS